MKGIRILLASIRKADIEFNLINDNDKIVIGISGGKDSMALLYALNLYKKFSKANFELYPCMIDLGFPNFNPKEIKDYVNKLGYELKILDEKQVFTILKIQKEKQNLPNLPCSICSRMKKAIINKYAEKINANKVTFAHHKDDAIETLFLNEIYGGRFATFAPKMFLTNDQLTFIRPFIFVREKDVLKTIKEEQIPVFKSTCPNDKQTKREDIKNLLNSIYKQYPSSEDNFLKMLLNKEHLDLFFLHEEHKIEGTKYFYKLVLSKTDTITYQLFTKKKLTEDDLTNALFLVYDQEKLVGTCAIKKIEERKFEIVNYKFKNQKCFLLFVNDIKKELYSRFNPCYLNDEFLKNNKD